MEHIDEGTIHAWLDGALPADEGARIEAHVASCALCASAVAEARGLIAASSRILSALDDVPGGVIPVSVVTAESATREAVSAQPGKPEQETVSATAALSVAQGGASADAPADRLSTRGSRTRTPHRPWYRRPQWAAAAGISFLAVAATAVWQRSGSPTVMESASDRATSAAPMMAAEPAADAVQDSSAPGGAGIAAAAAPASQQAAAPPSLRSDASRANEAKQGATPAPAEARKEVAATAKRLVQGETAIALAERDVRRQATEPAAPPPPVVSSAEARARSLADTGGIKRVGANVADAITRSESARIAGEATAQRKASTALVEGVVATGASSATSRRAPARALDASRGAGNGAAPATPSMLAGCYRVLPVDVARGIEIETLVQLEFAGAGSDESRPAYAAREVGGRNTQLAQSRDPLRWTLSSDGAVVLVRGEGAAARRVTMRIGVPLDSLAAQQLQGTRMPCPSR